MRLNDNNTGADSERDVYEGHGIGLKHSLWVLIEREAKIETRTVSNMICVMVMEYLKNKDEKFAEMRGVSR